MLFSKPSRSIGIDIGSHSVKAVQMSKSGGRLRVDQTGYALVDRNQLNVDPIAAQAEAVREALRMLNLNQSLVVGALPGQNVVIRYPRLADMPDSQLDNAIEAEAGQNIPYELSEVFLDWTLLDKITDNEETLLRVLLVAAKHEVIESRVQIGDIAEIEYSILSVDSLALADAAEGCDFLRVGESVALVNLGATTTSVHFIKDGISSFIRDVSWGGRELIQAIAKGRHVEYGEAEMILLQAGTGEEGGSESTEQPPPVPEEAKEEAPKDSLSELGGSLLDPLDEELGDLGGIDDLGSPSGAPMGGGTQIGGPAAEQSVPELLASPLGRLVNEVRRSFDYYEQQLYERPVDRLILSGGVGQLSSLPDALAEELGLEQVEVANPLSSALLMGHESGLRDLHERPAQFMVAIGLAARGAAEL